MSTDFSNDLAKAMAAKQKGNGYFMSFKIRFHPDVKKRELYCALQCYEDARSIAGKDSSMSAVFRASAKNMGVAYRYLAELETLSKTKHHCFRRSAECFSEAFHTEMSPDEMDPTWATSTASAAQQLMTSFEDFCEGTEKDVNLKISMSHVMVQTLAGAGNFRELPPIGALLTELWLDLGTRQFNVAVKHVADKEYRPGLSMLKELYRSLEEAKRHLAKEDNADVRMLQKDYEVHMALAEGLQALHVGVEQFNIATMESEDLNMDLVFCALDKFVEAECLARGEDVEVACMALTQRGFLHLKCLNNRYAAKLIFKDVLNLAATLSGNLHSRDWYCKVASQVELMRQEDVRKEESLWQNQRKKFVVELKSELDELELRSEDSVIKLRKFLLTKFPPKHLRNAPKLTDTGESEKKMLQKLACAYHTDRVSKEEHGLKYYVLCEEIVKVVNNRYNMMKGV